jgi:acylphosphatase
VEIARDFQITGYVQNMLESSVKVVAEGREEDLLRFLDAVRNSHVFRYVTHEDLSWQAATGDLDSFTVRYA